MSDVTDQPLANPRPAPTPVSQPFWDALREERVELQRCEDCGRDIAASRLDAVPYARYCMECARDREKEGIRP